MPLPAMLTPTPARIIGAALLALLVSGCAQQQAAGRYDAPAESTQVDARNQAQGRHGTRAPSQIQLGFGDTGDKPAQAASAEQQAQPALRARPLAEAKTFLGTVPCLSGEAGCQASRLALTLAPDGQWRSRTTMLNASNTTAGPVVQRGCWSVAGTQPLRIVLQTDTDVAKASLDFVNDNVLRVNRINGSAPTLDYHLTRQADIDPIDELSGQAALSCDNLQ